MDIFGCLSELQKICEAKASEPLKNHTTFRVGGPAAVFAEPGTAEEAIKAAEFCRREGLPFVIIGRGSNVLFPDRGYDGVVVKIGPKMSAVRWTDGEIFAEAGASLAAVYSCAYQNGRTGFEELSGIPGFVGGAVRMNAGAYGREIRDVLKSCTYYYNGKIITAGAEELCLSYRKSIFSEMPGAIILSCVFSAGISDTRDNIYGRYCEFSSRRREKQPLDFPSAGSTFKRPEGYYASKLIDDCGLKGFGIGGAGVSEKHAGFVINSGGATAEDIIGVIEYVRKTVLEKFSVELEPEVEMIGF